MSAPVAGQVIGREFRLERPIGAGGMGEVWLATHLGTGRQRAVKLMNPALGLDPRACERFVEEARVGARIESEHVVEVVGVGVDAPTGMPWLAMELLDGEDLAHAIERGPLAAAELAALMEQVDHALGAAHAAGVVHRDLKPENLFLARPRRVGASTMVKILDFGIAAILPDDRSKATVTSALGTPLWWSPEQMQVGEHVRPATDVWSLGLIVFFALTGRFYWRAPYAPDASVARIVTEILVEPLRPASARARELGVSSALPSGFDAWFSSCVARDPSARFRDARAAVAALLPILRDATQRPHASSVAFAPTLEAPSSVAHAATQPSTVNAPTAPAVNLPSAVNPSPALSPPSALPRLAQPASTQALEPTRGAPAPSSRVLVAAVGVVVALALGALGVALSLRLSRDVRPPPPRLALEDSDAGVLTADAGVTVVARVEPAPAIAPSAFVRESERVASHAVVAAPPEPAAPAPSPFVPALAEPPIEPATIEPVEPPAPTVIELRHGTSTAAVGNPTGGDAHDDVCGRGEALIGVEGTSVPHLGQVRAVCGRLDMPSGTGPITVTGTHRLPTRGRLGEGFSSALCPADHVVVGFEGRSGLLVDRITVRCAPLSVDASGRVIVGPASSGRSIGGSGGHPSGTSSCGPGEIARGAHIRAGDSVDAFGLACGEPSAR